MDELKVPVSVNLDNQQDEKEPKPQYERYQLFLFDDVQTEWVKYFPKSPIDKSVILDAIFMQPLNEEIPDNQIMIEFVDAGTRCWDIVTLTALMAYQLIRGETPSHPITQKPFTIPTIAMLAMAFVMIEDIALNVPKPDVDKLISRLAKTSDIAELRSALLDPRNFFTEELCQWGKRTQNSIDYCKFSVLSQFIVPDVYKSNLNSEMSIVKKSVTARQAIFTKWNINTEYAMDQYWNMSNMKTTVLTNITNVMKWVGEAVVANILCPGTPSYNESTQTYGFESLDDNPEAQRALNHCTLALIIAYYKKVQFSLQTQILQSVALAAVVLAYKSLGLDDMAGCIITLSLQKLVTMCSSSYCIVEDVQNIEQSMYQLVNQTPCKEQFEVYVKTVKESKDTVISPAFPLNFKSA